MLSKGCLSMKQDCITNIVSLIWAKKIFLSRLFVGCYDADYLFSQWAVVVKQARKDYLIEKHRKDRDQMQDHHSQGILVQTKPWDVLVPYWAKFANSPNCSIHPSIHFISQQWKILEFSTSIAWTRLWKRFEVSLYLSEGDLGIFSHV